MISSSILSNTGLPMVLLGGDFVWRRRVTGDIVSEFKWLQDEPVMILYRAVPSTKTGAFIIRLEDAHKYAQSNGMPSIELMRDSMRAADSIGFFADKDAAKRMIDIILDGLPDLLAMPPMPPEQTKVDKPIGDGELSIKINGKTAMETLV